MPIYGGASGSSVSTITQAPIITGNNLSLGTSYELDGEYLKLKRYKNFSFWTQAIAVANSENGWTWTNRTSLDTTNCWENDPTYPGEVRFVHKGTDNNLVQRVKTYYNNHKANVFLARVRSNALTQNSQGSGIIFAESGGGNEKLWLAQIGGNIVIQSTGLGGTTNTAPGTVTATHVTNGVWLMGIIFQNRWTAWYSLTNTLDPTAATWVKLCEDTFSSTTGYLTFTGGEFIGQPISTFWSAYHSYFDDSSAEPLEGLGLVNPNWCAQGYSSLNDEIALVADFDMGTSAPGVNNTVLNNLLADAVNKLPGDLATWTFSSIQAATTGAVSSTYQGIGSIVTAGTGRRYNLFAKCNSDGFQAGSIRLPLNLKVITT